MAKIIAGLRSAVVPRAGAFSTLEIHQIAAPVINATLTKSSISAEDVDELIVSNALGAGGNPARLCVLESQLPERIAGLSIDRQCVGGLDAILLAADMVDAGRARVVVAGGVESYSRRPLRMRSVSGASVGVAYDRPAFATDAEMDPDPHFAMSKLAEEFSISRKAQEQFTINSHHKAIQAQDHIKREIVPIQGVEIDPYTRPLTKELMSRSPVLHGSVTAGTTSVSADAAAFVVVVPDDFKSTAEKQLSIVSSCTIGSAPKNPGLAPVAAIEAILQNFNHPVHVVELMEAYAVQAIACTQATGIDTKIVNPSGGALARGHPVGASGAILAVRLLNQLLPEQFGVAAIAAVGGIGTAAIFTRCCA